MSLPQKEEYGVELSARNASDPATGVPIKKRRFLFRRSPSPPPSHSTAVTADNCDIQTKEATFPELESSFFGVSGGQVPNSACADFRDPSLDCRAKNITCGEVNLAQNHGSSPSFSEGLLFTLSTTATTGLGNGGKLISENRPAVRPILGTIPETLEFRSTLGDGSFGNKLILSDKSAFQRVLANTELPFPSNRQCEPSLGEPTTLVGSAKEEQPSSCKLELTLSESQSSSLSKQADSGLGSSHDNQHSNRSHWDLNTTMDTWERSIVETTSSLGEGGNNKVDLGYIHCKRPEMDPIEKSCQESTGIHVMSGKCASENACSLKLPNTLKPAGESSGINTDLNLQLNTAFGSLPLQNLHVPFAPPSPSSHKMFDPSLSIKPITLTQSPKLASCDSVKTEPVEDGGSDKSVGRSNFKSVSHSIIKSEALDMVQQEGAKATCPNGVRMACGGAVKLEQLEVPCLGGPKTAEGQEHYHRCCSNAQETVNTGEMHHGKEGSAAWSRDFVAQGLVVDFNKTHDILGTPNVDASLVMGESLNKVVPNFGANPLVLNDTKLDLGQNMPSNADQPLGASPNIDGSSNIISESVISDVNDSQNAHMTPICVVPQDAEENVIKASQVFSESTAMVCNEPSQAKGAGEVVNSTSSVLLDSEHKEQRDVNHVPGIVEQISYSDSGTQLTAFVSMDVHTLHTSIDSNVTENDARGEIKKPELCKIENEPCGSHEAAGVKERVPKQHSDDDDYEDGEFRESLLRDAIKGNAKEKKLVTIKEGVKSDVPPMISSPVSENESKLQNPDESKDVHCTMESESRICTEKIDAGLNMTEDVKESPAIEKPITESNKKKAVKINRKMPQELGKEDSESKSTHKKILCSSPAKIRDNTGADLGSQQARAPANQSGPSKTGVSRTSDVTKHVKGRSDRSHIMGLSSSFNASPGRIKSSYSRSSSRSERERIKDKSVRGEKVHMNSSRDESQIRRIYKSEKERDPDQALRKAGSDRVHMRGRIVQQLDSLHGNWDPDHGYASEHFNMSTSSQYSRPKNASEVAFTVGMDGIFESAGRTGKKHVDDELCRPPPRRPSPGGSGPLPVGVQMVRRTMRDISPGRCAEEGIPELVMLNREGKLMRGFADDMVNPSLILRTRPNYEPGRNCLIRRERSLSPFQRRAAPHVSNIPFASSTRPRARSPHLWSPSRRPPDVFDGRPDLIRCRSPDLRVERMRSPGERACFQDNMLGRRHISPHIAQLHGEMTDANLMRGHDLPKPGRHPQGNLRRFDLIDHRVNPDDFGHLQSGQFRGLEGDDMYAEERRNSDEGHGLARPFRQHYIVGDDVVNDGSFHHRVEDIPPRPIRLCQDADEEFPGRGISRVGSIRNRLGNMHNRRLRGMDEQEDNYRHDNGQGWHGTSFKDVRLKRRRF